MDKKFKKYLEKIEMGIPFQKTVQTFIDNYNHLCDQELEEMFVSEGINKEGERNYELLLLISKGYVYEVTNFLTNPEMWLTKYKDRVQCVGIRFTDYNFNKATTKSRLSCSFHWEQGTFSLELKASRSNCDNLRNIIKSFVPHFK